MSGVGKIEKKAGNRFLSYYEMEAIHRDGSTSPYYMASRNPDPAALTAVTHQSRPNGVAIYSLLGEKVVLVHQYRYPVGGYVYEFPAGLVEPGENVQQAAIREMGDSSKRVMAMMGVPWAFRYSAQRTISSVRPE